MADLDNGCTGLRRGSKPAEKRRCCAVGQCNHALRAVNLLTPRVQQLQAAIRAAIDLKELSILGNDFAKVKIQP
ncbi:hypothetical protein [Mesorhizobium muleiense]|uniref:hypothetical protein n=1 Tax=Mesorhizobium muleiense TaxID=1004279 RepID=UPI001F35EA45|nr:hypothetical protein [Mesorhizobium muleiense]MCF6112811.1 hypothetical protein [Mesorhizobium muleiense]